jgi:hypothetical protein
LLAESPSPSFDVFVALTTSTSAFERADLLSRCRCYKMLFIRN